MTRTWANETIRDAVRGRPYQLDACKFIANHDNVALTDEPGLGKTLQTLAGISMRPEIGRVRRTLVLAPKVALETVWAAEISRWLGDSAISWVVTGDRQHRQDALDMALNSTTSGDHRDEFVICNIEMARIKSTKNENTGLAQFDLKNAIWPELYSIEWDNIVIDEAHRSLIKTQGQKTQSRVGVMALRGRNRIALTGTPMRGKPQQMWGMLNWLRPKEYSSYWKFVKKYFEIFSDGYSDYIIGDMYDDAIEEMSANLKHVVLRRTKGEVAKDLPPKLYNGEFLIEGDNQSPVGIWLDMLPAQVRQYKKMVKMGQLGDIIANGRLAEMMRMRQICNGVVDEANSGLLSSEIRYVVGKSPKVDWVLDRLETLGIESGSVAGDGPKIVIASQFNVTLDFLAQALTQAGYSTFQLDGRTSDSKRSAMMRSFQSDKADAQIFLLNTTAGGVAITLDKADDLVMFDETYVPSDSVQVEDRIHRVSRNHQVVISYLRMRDTIEEEVALVNAAKFNIQAYLLDGSRGIETARKLYSDSRQNVLA